MYLLDNNKHKLEYTCEYCGESNYQLTFITRKLPKIEPEYTGGKYTVKYIMTEKYIRDYTKMATCNWCESDIVIYFDRRGYGTNYTARIEHDPSLRPLSVCKYQKMFGHFRPWPVVSKKITIPPYVNHNFGTYLCPKHPFVVHGYDAKTYVSHADHIMNRFMKLE